MAMKHPLTGLSIHPDDDASDGQRREDSVAGRFAIAPLLMAISTGLFVVFLAYVIVDSLPLQLLNPRWQLAFAARLLTTAILPLVGFACAHLAVVLNPTDALYVRRLVTLRQAAAAAAIGFLLLIFLQGFATWRSYTLANAERQALTRSYKRRIAPVRQAISSATSTADLQQKLMSIEGLRLRLAPEDLSLPLSVVKKAVDDNISREENLYLDRISGPKPEQTWSAIQSGTRTLVASLGFFFAFAAGAQFGNSPLTLRDRISGWIPSMFGLRRRRSRTV